MNEQPSSRYSKITRSARNPVVLRGKSTRKSTHHV